MRGLAQVLELRERTLPDALLPRLLAVSATAIMQPRDLLQISRWAEMFIQKKY